MKLWIKILLSLVVILGIGAGLFLFSFKKFLTPTIGPRIATYAKPAKALLVIDVQEDFTGLKGKQPALYENAEGRINTINKLIDNASSAGMRVIYIRNQYDNNWVTRTFIGRGIEGLPGAEVDARIKKVSANEFTKKMSDSFSNPDLEKFLIANQVNELYLTGLDGVYCVHKTALGGMNRGYTVKIVTDAILSRRRMDKVLEMYKQDRIGTITSEQLLSKLQFRMD